MRLFATTISLRGKAILIAAGIAAISVPFSIGVLRAQIPSQTAQTRTRPEPSPNIVGDYIAVVMPPGTSEQPETPQSQSRPVAPPNAVRPGGTPKWEAVSIRPCPPDVRGTGGGRGGGGRGGGLPGGPFRFSSDRMNLNCLTVKSFIRSAYHLYLDLESSPMDGVLIRGIGEFAGFPKDPLDGTDGGPDWLDTDLYTIEAKAEGVTDRALMQGPMLQAILEDRFKIKVHRATRERAVDALVIARGGSKLKPFVEGSCIRRPPGEDSRTRLPQNIELRIRTDANGKLSGTMESQRDNMPLSDFRVEGQALSFGGPGGSSWKGSIEDNGARLNGVFTGGPNSMPLVFTRVTAQTVRLQRYCRIGGGGLSAESANIVYDAEGVTIGEFAKLFLSGPRGRFVIDKTGLKGKFNIHLESEISAEVRQRPALADVPFGPSTAPPLPAALQQQLGLRLETTKGPVEFLVIDHIERPSPN